MIKELAIKNMGGYFYNIDVKTFLHSTPNPETIKKERLDCIIIKNF